MRRISLPQHTVTLHYQCGSCRQTYTLFSRHQTLPALWFNDRSGKTALRRHVRRYADLSHQHRRALYHAASSTDVLISTGSGSGSSWSAGSPAEHWATPGVTPSIGAQKGFCQSTTCTYTCLCVCVCSECRLSAIFLSTSV